MKAKVIKRYYDKELQEYFVPGTEIEVSDERFSILYNANVIDIVEVAMSKEVKKKKGNGDPNISQLDRG